MKDLLMMTEIRILIADDAPSVSDAVGYALYKKKSDEQGRLAGIVLYQCVADPDCAGC